MTGYPGCNIHEFIKSSSDTPLGKTDEFPISEENALHSWFWSVFLYCLFVIIL